MITVGESKAVIVKGDYTPAEMYRGNNKIAGFHDSKTTVPSVVEGTYNDTVKITAKGQSFQKIYDETEPQTGSLIQMDLPAGQPIDVVINIVAKQDGEGEPSLENIRAIYGYDSLTLTVCGRNLMDKRDSLISAIREETAFSTWGGTAFDYEWVCSHLKPNTTYRISYEIECISVPEYDAEFSSNVGLLLYSTKKGSSIGGGNHAYLGQGQTLTVNHSFTTPSDIDDPTLGYRFLAYTNRYLKDGKGVHSGMIIRNLQITVGEDTPDAYLPYIGYTKNILLPETSYGGYIDWTKKKYVKTYEKHICTGEEAWQNAGSLYGGNYFLAYNSLRHNPGSKQMCNQMPISNPYTDDSKNCIWVLGDTNMNQIRIGLIEPQIESAVDLKSYLKQLYDTEVPVEIVYELTEPMEYDLSEQIDDEIFASKDGVTTVFSDQASVTVNGAETPSPLHPSEMIASSGTVHSRGKNLWNPNADFSNAADYPSGNGYYGYRMDLKPNTSYTISAKGNKRLYYVIVTTTNQHGQHPTTSVWLSHCTNATLSMPNGYVVIRTREDGRLFINVNGGNTSERFMTRMAENFDCLQIEEGILPSEYVPYLAPSQSVMPVLRAIPDGIGGYVVRDELTSVPTMPGWYDLTRNVAEYIVNGKEQNVGDMNLYAHADTTNVGLVQNAIYQNIDDICLCNIALYNDKNKTPWSTNIPGVTVNKNQLHMNILNSITGVTDDMTASEKRAKVNAYLRKRYEDGNPVIFWGNAGNPTTERIYLGNLKTYPRYTVLSSEGIFLPDIQATVKVSD